MIIKLLEQLGIPDNRTKPRPSGVVSYIFEDRPKKNRPRRHARLGKRAVAGICKRQERHQCQESSRSSAPCRAKNATGVSSRSALSMNERTAPNPGRSRIVFGMSNASGV